MKIGAMAWSSAVEQIRAGNVQALGVSSQNRLAGFPDVPTFRELGYPDLVAATWFSLSGPAKLPTEISHKLNAAVVEVMQEPDVQKQLAQDGIEFKALTPGGLHQVRGSRDRPLGPGRQGDRAAGGLIAVRDAGPFPPPERGRMAPKAPGGGPASTPSSVLTRDPRPDPLRGSTSPLQGEVG